MIYSITLRSICFSLLLLAVNIYSSVPSANEIPEPSKLKKKERSLGHPNIEDIALAYASTQFDTAQESLPITYQTLKSVNSALKRSRSCPNIARVYNATHGIPTKQTLPSRYKSLRIDTELKNALAPNAQEYREQKQPNPKVAKIFHPRPIKPALLAFMEKLQK